MECPCPSSIKAKKLKYHSSWDWLIPVAKKCHKTANGKKFNKIIDDITIFDIDATYNAIVEFIMEYDIKRINKEMKE